MPPKRMTANPVKAPRYRAGKAVAEQDSSDSESDDDETEESKPVIAPPPKVSTAGGITSSLSKANLDVRRKAAAAKEAARIEEERARKLAEEEGFVTASEEESDEGSGEEEESSEEEEESEEEEAPRRLLIRPTFIKKDKRNGASAAAAAQEDLKTEEELIAAEEARRKKMADEIVEEQIRKDLAAKAVTLNGARTFMEPDALFSVNGRNFALEADKGTESIKAVIVPKILAYREIVAAGIIDDYLGVDNLRVLFATTSRKRMHNVMNELASIARDGKSTMFGFRADDTFGDFLKSPIPTGRLIAAPWQPSDIPT